MRDLNDTAAPLHRSIDQELRAEFQMGLLGLLICILVAMFIGWGLAGGPLP